MEEHAAINPFFIRSAVEHAGNAVLISEAAPTLYPGPAVLYINPAFTQITGYSAESLIGKPLYTLMKAELSSVDPQKLGADFHENGFIRVQFCLFRQDGTPFWSEVRVRNIPQSDDYPPHWIIYLSDITRQRELTQEMQHSESRYRAFAEGTTDGIWISDATGKVLHLSRQMEEDYPLPESGDWRDLLHTEDRQNLKSQSEDQWAESIATGSRYENFYRMRRRDGEYRWHRFRAVPVRDDNGTIQEWVGSVTDIQDRINAETKLRESERLLSYALEASQDGLFDWNPQTHSLSVNNAYLNMLGYELADFPGHDSFSEAVIHSNDLAGLVERTTALLSGTVSIMQSEHRMRHRDGHYLWVIARAKVVEWDDTGLPIRVVGTNTDITRRRTAEDNLRQREGFLRRLLESVPSCIKRMDAQGTILSINEEGCRLLEASDESELLGENWIEMWPQEHQRMVHEQIENALNGRAARFQNYAPTLRGTRRCWSTVLTAFKDGAGDEPTVVAVSNDITDRKQLEEERERLLEDALRRADLDSLTGLLNHGSFQRRVKEFDMRKDRQRSGALVALMDVKNFKFFNDAYGHLVGDSVLRLIAKRIREPFDDTVVLARIGGDEFALLLEDATWERQETLRQTIEETMRGIGYTPVGYKAEIPLEMSVGIAAVPQDAKTLIEALRIADKRLIESKNGYEPIFTESLRGQLAQALPDFLMIDALVSAVDNKDRYTRQHSEDVLIYSLTIALALDLSHTDCAYIMVAALIHDVGKIGIPDHVLRLPGKLSASDYAAIRQHPALGAALVASLKNLDGTVDAVRHHHEHWNGRGYPGGLSGEEIPLMARLMAVADTFSALTTDRPYRRGVSPDAALGVLRRGAGEQWDPRMVDTFAKAWNSDWQREKIVTEARKRLPFILKSNLK